MSEVVVCHTGRYKRQDCPHILKRCDVCGGSGVVQPDLGQPGESCPNEECDTGAVVVGTYVSFSPFT